MGPDEAREWVQQLDGIGPFYASLIVLRAVGFSDVLVDQEPRLRSLVQRLYGLDEEPGPEELAAIAEPWRPRRTWAAVLVRAAGPGLNQSDLSLPLPAYSTYCSLSEMTVPPRNQEDPGHDCYGIS